MVVMIVGDDDYIDIGKVVNGIGMGIGKAANARVLYRRCALAEYGVYKYTLAAEGEQI